MVIAARGGQAAVGNAGTISVCAKSVLLEEQGNASLPGQGVRRTVATVQAGGVAAFAETKEGITGDPREFRIMNDGLSLQIAEHSFHRYPRRRVAAASRRDHQCFLQTDRGETDRRCLLQAPDE